MNHIRFSRFNNFPERLLGIRASIGAVHVVPPELEGANLSRGIARIVPGPEIDAHYLALFLSSRCSLIFWSLAKQGTTFNEISIETVRSLPVLVPPLEEQRTILTRVEDETRRIDSSCARLEREAALFLEYRTRLITDVVTGKLDVRSAAAQFPGGIEEVELVEGFDDLEDRVEVALDAEPESAEEVAV